MIDLQAAKDFVDSMYYEPKKLMQVAPNTWELVICGAFIAVRYYMDINPQRKDDLIAGCAAYGFGSCQNQEFETLWGDTMPLPPQAALPCHIEYYTDDVATWWVWTEMKRLWPMRNWKEYTNLCLFAALSKHNEGKDVEANELYDYALESWDGLGFYDQYVRDCGHYHPYPIGICMYVARALGRSIPAHMQWQFDQVLARSQGDDGGIITLYDLEGVPFGTPSEEPTMFVIMGYEYEHLRHQTLGGWKELRCS
ncbi:MAG: hypothetical protein SVY53_05960 [Chloroflexota bacterium]|nr:hypothetical protein [Chloroflexota bacterium]